MGYKQPYDIYALGACFVFYSQCFVETAMRNTMTAHVNIRRFLYMLAYLIFCYLFLNINFIMHIFALKCILRQTNDFRPDSVVLKYKKVRNNERPNGICFFFFLTGSFLKTIYQLLI